MQSPTADRHPPPQGLYRPQGGGSFSPGSFAPLPRKAGLPRWAALVVVATAVLVPLAIVFVAVVLPSLESAKRRSQTAEARANIERIFTGLVAHHSDTLLCPNDGRVRGTIGPTPSVTVDCHRGSEGCVPDGAGRPGYPAEVWGDTVWGQIGFSMSDPHHFHYGFRWENGEDGCRFVITAHGDLDGDGLFSTFEQPGRADELGAELSEPMRIDHELE